MGFEEGMAMNYQIKAFAELTGVSERTLRYYHECGLLVPAVASNGYRSYSSQDADRLQLILMYRRLQFSLAEIQQLLALPPAERLTHLAAKRDELAKQQAVLTATLAQLDATLQNQTGGSQMTDQTKFEQFKQQAIAENDQRYGQEVMANYGEQAKQEADQHFAAYYTKLVGNSEAAAALKAIIEYYSIEA